MNQLRWLFPGLRVKRWIAVIAMGIILFGTGSTSFAWRFLQDKFDSPIVWYGTLQFISYPTRGYLFVLLGLALLLLGFSRLYGTFLSPFLSLLGQRPLVEQIWLHSRGTLGPNIVALGGGKDFHALLRSLKAYSSNVVAIVPAPECTIQAEAKTADSVFNDGEEPIHCLLALAEVEQAMSELFALQVKSNDGDNTESFAKVLLRAIATGIHCDPSEAIRCAGRVLAVRGQVIPATAEALAVEVHELDGYDCAPEGRQGALVVGQGKPRLHVSIHPRSPLVVPDALMAILDADLLVVGPGSMSAHILPLFLIEPIANAFAISSAIKMFVSGAGEEPCGTHCIGIQDQVETLLGLPKSVPFHFMVLNHNIGAAKDGEVPWELARKGLPKPVVLTRHSGESNDEGQRVALQLIRTYYKVAGRWARSRAR